MNSKKHSQGKAPGGGGYVPGLVSDQALRDVHHKDCPLSLVQLVSSRVLAVVVLSLLLTFFTLRSLLFVGKGLLYPLPGLYVGPSHSRRHGKYITYFISTLAVSRTVAAGDQTYSEDDPWTYLGCHHRRS